jgi:2-polyprenyl-3-methyl-5-hydroxy-6-metoxy-1,4-benzoquinol methylase
MTDTAGERMFKTRDAGYAAAMGNEYHRTRFAIALRMLKRATDLRGKVAYDFGCGTGEFTRILQDEGVTAHGSDPSAELLGKAPPPLRDKLKQGGVEALAEQPSAHYDLLVVLNVLPYLKDDERVYFWKEAPRVLKPGGLLITANPNTLAAAEGHYYWMANPDTLPSLLQQHGLQEIDQEYFRYYPLFIGRGQRVVDLNKLDWIPNFIKRARSTSYFSLSRRTGLE